MEEIKIGQLRENQISFVTGWLKNNYHIDEIFDWSDPDDVYLKMSKMTLGQYQAINRGHRQKIYAILETLGFKHK